jgi:thermostable 8-oxoguanine DNA glycosylase
MLEAFRLNDLTILDKATVLQRIMHLAEYTAAYEASYEKLSNVLAKRTRKLRALEDADVETQAQVERLRIIAAAQSQMMQALFVWEASIGSDAERQAMADLREAMTAYRYNEAQR